MRKKDIFLVFGFLIILAIPLTKACVEPENRKELTSDTNLCEGEFYLDYGLEVESDNIVIKCNNTTIKVNADEPNDEGFTIENKKNVTIKDCKIHGFQFGVLLLNSENITLINNTFRENLYGIYFIDSFVSKVRNNSFHDNIEDAIYIGENSKGNIFDLNIFNHSSFNLNEPSENPYNTYQNNEYINSTEIGNHQTEYEHEEEQETNDLENQEGEHEEQIRIITRQGSQDPQEILQMVYEAKDLDNRNFQEDLKKINETLEKVDIIKTIYVDYKKNTTQVNTSFILKEDLESLRVFEYIPKTLAENASEDIIFKTEDYEILSENPLIMWEFSDTEEGDEIETSYTTTRAMEEGGEEPTTTVCIDCARKEMRYNFLIPLILVPIIVIGFILFEKYHHKPRNLK